MQNFFSAPKYYNIIYIYYSIIVYIIEVLKHSSLSATSCYEGVILSKNTSWDKEGAQKLHEVKLCDRPRSMNKTFVWREGAKRELLRVAPWSSKNSNHVQHWLRRRCSSSFGITGFVLTGGEGIFHNHVCTNVSTCWTENNWFVAATCTQPSVSGEDETFRHKQYLISKSLLANKMKWLQKLFPPVFTSFQFSSCGGLMPCGTFLKFSTIITDQDGNFLSKIFSKSLGKLDNKKKRK